MADVQQIVQPGGAAELRALVGGKAYNLARLQETGVSVPKFVALSAGLFETFTADLLPHGAPEPEAGEAVRIAPMPPALREQVREAVFSRFRTGDLVAVRSSAVAEDGAGSSFAGQFESVLGVPVEDGLASVLDAVRRVWASAFSEHALAYAAGERPRMAVVIQEMVGPLVSGVAFTADPVTGERETVVISAVFGLGEGLVSAELNADAYHVRTAGGTAKVVSVEIASKPRALRLLAGGGTRWEELDPSGALAEALTEEEARRLALACRQVEEAFGTPQDIEWALTAGADGERRFVFLQARPITTLPPAPAREGEHRIWDNSNIAESYGGVTYPLTFSFARSVYESVYRQFCELMGVSPRLVRANEALFANMLGSLRGRVYYNLLNWYRMLALLPGFSVNRAFMERMMGVKQKLEHPPPTPYASGRWEDAGRLLRMLWRMLREQRRLKRAVPAFHAHVDAALAPLAAEDLSRRTPDELVALFRGMERRLLDRWQTPLVNDFFAMIWFGVLSRLVEAWLPKAPPTLMNDLLCGEGEIISAQPAREVMRLAGIVRGNARLRALFASEPDAERLWARLNPDDAHPAFVRELQAYLARFGDRCMNELKLETVTLSENPAFLLQMVQVYADAGMTDPGRNSAHEAQVRAAAEAVVREALSGLRRAAFEFVVRQARRRVRDRENLRFERTRVFGLVRRIFVALGGHLHRAGALAEPKDVFFLTREEVFACVEGTAVSARTDRIVALRKEEYAAYEQEPAPPERIETWGPPALTLGRLSQSRTRSAASDGGLRGMGCCPGVVRAPVRIVRDPRSATGLKGSILVAERTDPGWTLLFPAVRGLLVERGSLLSHSAIVAREMALPCVVGISGLLATLQDGEWVEMDGATGLVRRLAPEEIPAAAEAP